MRGCNILFKEIFFLYHFTTLTLYPLASFVSCRAIAFFRNPGGIFSMA
ncbi:MAG: hypothetical protein PHP66_07220 [Syntrophales bacterium]|nr:hypothetical protein [Syntrophales bacterium]